VLIPNEAFWHVLDTLVQTSTIVIDRPRGSAHPHYPEMIYPLDYGYLQGTHGGDGAGIDVWVGKLPDQQITAIIVSVDLTKRDSEIKILLGCTPDEQQLILKIQNAWQDQQAGLLIVHP